MENLSKKTKAQLIEMLEQKEKPVVHNYLHMNGKISVSNKTPKADRETLKTLSESILTIAKIIEGNNKGGNYGVFMSSDSMGTNKRK